MSELADHLTKKAAVCVASVGAAAGKLARKIFGRFLARGLPVVVPLIGTLAGGTINDLSMRAVGNAARNFYEAKPARKARKRKAKRPRSSRRRTEARRDLQQPLDR